MFKETRNDIRLIPNIGPSNITLSIFLISVLGLFLEMMLIRWIATEIRIFAYLQNTILVVCFLGLGLGCFTSHLKINLRSTILPLFAITLIVAIPITREGLGNISLMLSALRDYSIFYQIVTTSTSQTIFYVIFGLSCTFFVMLLILDMFVPIGRILGGLLNRHPNPIWAYSVNIAGSLAGTWLFVIVSRLYAPPFVWCSVLFVLLLFFINETGRARVINLTLCSGILVLSWFAGIEQGAMEVVWSPYQKLTLREANPQQGELGKYRVSVNNIRYQELIDLSPNIKETRRKESETGIDGYSQYDIQLLLHPNPKKVLILGAGTGNDAAGGLRNGVEEITAVDIDPAIISMGRRYHPQNPYNSPLVKIVNDDARSFLATSNDRFDVISFGFLDSVTSSVMTNTRLDEYVYTRESLEKAKSLLRDGGIIAIIFGAQEYFIANRLANTMHVVFGEAPLSFFIPKSDFGHSGIMFVVGNLTGVKEQISKDPILKSLIEKWQKQTPLKFTYTTPVLTDDWPYLYLKDSSIPMLFYLLAGLMILLFIRSRWRWEVSGIFVRWNYSHWHFFFLGTGFMLLEVQNISKAAVVLGSTWLVNAIIISGVLMMVLVANMITAKFRKLPLLPVYITLFAICLLLYYVDLARFAFLPYLPKAILIGALTTLPMIFSGMIFIHSFANVEKKDQALGANLLGALVGALLQSITFMTGIKALLLIVIGLYVASLLFLLRSPFAKT